MILPLWAIQSLPAWAQVLAMTNLVAAYQQNDIMAFERILRTNKRALH